ncbi:hypothetical protein EWM62_09485 [Mucilaginibacter terrigena]|uniref:Outer membrane protein beta-barrel domain-containing protein n=1 Tax=Mucilaginibacter terrigena TaxID=2492395 RepID=A0A4Q5LNC0_9SPHI|nr:hypothetical protein [Mucilaginibacter terrigena]RYU90862.1 hypothetical protein EWM62_09485 [Mucilaginibacter terrigena]
MIKLLTKTTFFTLILSAVTLISKAQIGYDYAQYDVGFGGSINQVYGDAESVTATKAANVSFIFNQTPFVNYIVELQNGNLEGGDRQSKSGRYFKNGYTAILFRGQLQAGELFDYSNGGLMNVMKNFYLSTGFGYIFNNIQDKNINRTSNAVSATTGEPYITGGLNKSNELYIPARIGYEFKFFNQYNQPSFKIDIAYQFNMDLTDNMDGFTAGSSRDNMVQYSIGLKFALGDVVSYRKSIN